MPNLGYKEAFLHYVWQFQYFDKSDIKTTSGERVHVLSPGFLNKDSGPDFYNSKILINEVEWHGTTEVHYKTSDWINHNHTTDKAYNSVILHLVWEEDIQIKRQDQTYIPTIELKNRVDKEVITLYQNLIKNTDKIPCEKSLPEVDEYFIYAMLEKALIERLELKSDQITKILSKNINDWEQTCYQWIGKCFGFKINSDAFYQLCNNLPYSIARKYSGNRSGMDALMFGYAGFLNSSLVSDYTNRLKKEFAFLQSKHSIQSGMELPSWKFLRLRPANFPTLRIAQFSAFIAAVNGLTEMVFQNSLNDIKISLSQSLDPYWSHHYHFEKEASKDFDPSLGSISIENLLINAIIPLRFAYANKYGDENLKSECLELYKQIKAEKNHITLIYNECGLKIPTSFESQAFVHLHNVYCVKKQCLSCIIGHQIIHPVAESI